MKETKEMKEVEFTPVQPTNEVVTYLKLCEKIKENSDGHYHLYEIQDILELFASTLRQYMKEQATVKFTNLGTFCTRKVQTSKRFNFKSGETTYSATSPAMKLVVSPVLKEELRQNFKALQEAE